MATKAERFKYEAQRSGAPLKKTAKKKSGAARRPARAAKATVAFEEVAKATPRSRKSTRRSKHRQKGATTLTGRNLLLKSSPHNRHDVGTPTQRAPR